MNTELNLSIINYETAKNIALSNREKSSKLLNNIHSLATNLGLENELKWINKMLADENFQKRLLAAPASGSKDKHGSWEGGLIDHSYLVYTLTYQFFSVFWRSLKGQELTNQHYFHIAKLALIHDLGKIGTVEGQPYYLPQTEDYWIKKGYNYFTNEELTDLKHEDYSILWCKHFEVPMDSQDYKVVRYHDSFAVINNHEFCINERSALIHAFWNADNSAAKVYGI